MKKLQHFFKLFTFHLSLFTVLLLSSCSAPSALGFGTETMTGPTGSGATAPTSGQSGSGSGSSGSGSGDADAAPQASIPLPNVRSEYIVAYATDDADVIPVKGFAGAADYDASYQMLVSTEDPATYVAARTTVDGQRTTSKTLYTSRFTNPLLPKAYADDLDFGLCSETSATCCPILPDGSFMCNLQTSASVGSVFYTIVAEGNFVEGYDAATSTTLVATAEIEDINTNALWLAQAPKDLVYTSDGVSSHIAILGQDALLDVSLGTSTDSPNVIGDYTSSYVLESVLNAEGLAATTSGDLTYLMPSTGVSIWSSAVDRTYDTLSATDSGNVATVDYTEEYTTLKTTTHGDIWFGRQPSSEYWDTGAVYEFIYSPDLVDCCGRSDTIDDYRIPIFDKNALGEIFSETVALDVDTNKTAVAVFKDTSGEYRMSVGYYDSIAPYPAAVLGSTTSFMDELIDIAFVKDQSGISDSTTQYGSVAILDKTNGRVYFEDYFAKIDSTETGASDVFDDTALENYVEVGTSPISMAFNADRDTLFVLNEGDNTITVFNVKDSAGTVLPVAAMAHTKQTINLSDYFVGKSLTFTPNKIIVQEASSGLTYIMIGLEGIEGAAVFEAPRLLPPRPALRPMSAMPEFEHLTGPAVVAP